MKRRAVTAVLTIAGLIGVGGGSFSAYAVRPSAQGTPGGPASTSLPTTRPTPDNSPQPSPDKETTAAGPGGSLFYFADEQINDGARAVPVTLSRPFIVSSVQRVGDGWLVVQLESEGGEQENYFGTYVYADGSTWELGGLGQTWDIDADGRILFSPATWEWRAADPATHKLADLEILDGPGEDLPYMPDGDPAPWIQWAGSGVLTGWQSPDGAKMIITETGGYTHTEVGPIGVYRPNTSPNGRLAVGSAPPEPQAQPICLSGGNLEANHWWQNCDYMRFSYSSPYSPNGKKLLALDTHVEGWGPDRFAILDARTGKLNTWVEVPKWTYDAAWADDHTLTVLARPKKTSESTDIYQVDLDGSKKLIKRVRGEVALGDA